MADIKEIAWVAGLLEGEGCFMNRSTRYCSPYIQLMMTDGDIVIRAAQIMGAHKVIKLKQVTKANKLIYRMNVYGRQALAWMFTIYIFLGDRRQSRLREIFAAAKYGPRSPYPERKGYSRGGEIAWSKA